MASRFKLSVYTWILLSRLTLKFASLHLDFFRYLQEEETHKEASFPGSMVATKKHEKTSSVGATHDLVEV